MRSNGQSPVFHVYICWIPNHQNDDQLLHDYEALLSSKLLSMTSASNLTSLRPDWRGLSSCEHFITRLSTSLEHLQPLLKSHFQIFTNLLSYLYFSSKSISIPQRILQHTTE
jgi:hypothetical protein